MFFRAFDASISVGDTGVVRRRVLVCGEEWGGGLCLGFQGRPSGQDQDESQAEDDVEEGCHGQASGVSLWARIVNRR